MGVEATGGKTWIRQLLCKTHTLAVHKLLGFLSRPESHIRVICIHAASSRLKTFDPERLGDIQMFFLCQEFHTVSCSKNHGLRKVLSISLCNDPGQFVHATAVLKFVGRTDFCSINLNCLESFWVSGFPETLETTENWWKSATLLMQVKVLKLNDASGWVPTRSLSESGRCHGFLFICIFCQRAMLQRIRPFRAIQQRRISTASSPYDNYTKLRGANFVI